MNLPTSTGLAGFEMSQTRKPPEYQEKYASLSSSAAGPPSLRSPRGTSTSWIGTSPPASPGRSGTGKVGDSAGKKLRSAIGQAIRGGAGRIIAKRHVPEGESSRIRSPPWAWAIERDRERPSPVPPG